MARIILSGLLNDIRNAVGSLVYSAWKGVHYVRNKAATVSNPNSTDQANIRARMSAAAKRWYDVLTVAQRDLWNEYAQGLGSAEGSDSAQEGGTKVVIPTNRGIMSGFNAYVMAMCLNYTAGVYPVSGWSDDAPLGITPPNAPTVLICSPCFASPVNQIMLTWTDPAEPPVLGVGRIRVFAVSLDGGVHRQQIANVPKAQENYTFNKAKSAQGAENWIHNLPGHYHVQIDAVNQYGQKSAPSNVCQPIIPAPPVELEACPP